MRRVGALGATMVMTLSGVVVSAGPAAACPTVPYYGLSASQVRVPFKGIPHFKNGPGGKVIATRQTDKSVSAQVTAGAETEVGAVLAKAKVSVSASLTRSKNTSVIVSYERKIPRGKFGNLRYVSYGKKVKWTKYRFDGSCKERVVGRGTINFPTNSEGWYYWTSAR